ncbi:MAG: hypothetical protein KYX64_08180 [Sphingopyxis sp.]|nr:hypothetical protein [Sphingopyxis sp.]
MALFRGTPNREPYSDDEANARLPIWCAFAELFLDTEQRPEDCRRIGEVISGRGFDRPALFVILAEEVAPAFAHNIFLDIAGEWAGWPSDYVRERVLTVIEKGPSWLLPKKRVADYVEQEWLKIEPYLT